MNWHRFEDHGLRLFRGVNFPDSWSGGGRRVAQPPAKTVVADGWVYGFRPGAVEIGEEHAHLLGMKGANLAEMCRMGLPVPPGFIVTTRAFAEFKKQGRLTFALKAEVLAGLVELEKATQRRFGDARRPLLVSVRPGARVPMPGQMESVLDLGLNDEIVAHMARSRAPGRGPLFALETYRRFIQSFADIIFDIPAAVFEGAADDFRASCGLAHDAKLSHHQARLLVGHFKALVRERSGREFPQDPLEQLWMVLEAAFRAWDDERTTTFRRMNAIPHEWGTAVVIQQMVFGNCGRDCATGYLNTRDPETGEQVLCGRYLPNAQGLDLFLGFRVPAVLSRREQQQAGEAHALPPLEEQMPEIYARLVEISARLEAHFKDAQFTEFTVQDGALFLLQTQPAQRSARAAVQIAVDLAEQGLISRQMAVLRVSPNALDPLLHPTLDPDAEKEVLTTGMAASPGAASGPIAFRAQEVQSLAAQGKSVIFVCAETGPKDVQALAAAAGVLTGRGGMTSHAAVMARGMGKPCVTGGVGLHIDMVRETISVAGRRFRAGDVLTIDGTSGDILAGEVAMRHPCLSGAFATLMRWADSYRRMQVRANAEMPRELTQARRFGAEGLGLCRTEQMFFEPAGLTAIRRMILAENEADRKSALDQLALLQQRELTTLFEIMAGDPITIRLFDPPLHEFLPKRRDDLHDVAEKMGISDARLRRRVEELAESNPMLGHRGCRLAITYPAIADMQARAIFLAAIEAEKRTSRTTQIEIMVPFVAMKSEFDLVRARIDAVAQAVAAETGRELSYKVGAMIEVPRAALRSDLLGESADFLSFGTNDLTQMVLGLSRDDAAKFLGDYLSGGVWETDPFVVLDQAGVGRLLADASRRGRQIRADIVLGVCGEHGGDPESIRFFEEIGLDYVSCSPFRVPVARLAAAQATLLVRGGDSLKGTSSAPKTA